MSNPTEANSTSTQQTETEQLPPVQPFDRVTAMDIDRANDFIMSQNMQKLCQKDTFLISGKVYNRRRLNPRQKLKLIRLVNQMSTIENKPGDEEKAIEQYLKLQCEAACLCFTNFSEADFNKEDMDAMMLDQVVAACLLIAKGFRGL